MASSRNTFAQVAAAGFAIKSVCLIVKRGPGSVDHMNRALNGDVVEMPPGTFRTGYWVYLTEERAAGCIGATVSLHESKDELSWCQGIVTGYERGICTYATPASVRGKVTTILEVQASAGAVPFHNNTYQRCYLSLSLA